MKYTTGKTKFKLEKHKNTFSSGKENHVIVLSLVRSSSDNEIRSDLLQSVQRLNVAITRAKYKLILGRFHNEKNIE